MEQKYFRVDPRGQFINYIAYMYLIITKFSTKYLNPSKKRKKRKNLHALFIFDNSFPIIWLFLETINNIFVTFI